MDFFNIWGATIIVMIILGTFGYDGLYDEVRHLEK